MSDRDETADPTKRALHALLVEDNPGDARLLEEIARETGLTLDFHRVDRVAGAVAAITGGEDIDFIISDLGLPDSVGRATVEALREAAPACPIIVLTGSSASDQSTEVLRAGADDYLVKGSIDADTLSRSVRYAIERRKASQRVQEMLREEARILGTLHRIGVALASELDLEGVVQRVTDEATAACGAAFGAFFYNRVDERGESYTLYTLSGVDRSAFERFPMPRNTHVFGPTFRGEGVIRSDDITADRRYGQNPPYNGMPAGHLPVRSYLAVPVQGREGKTIGGLFFGHPDAGVFSERAEQIVVGIASSAGLAMDNARLYEAEQRARDEAEKANSAKADFLATMSHELRTPLNAMIGYTDLWMIGLPEDLPPRMVPQVERVRSSAQHLLGLIEEILTFSRLEAAQEQIEAEDFALADLVESVAGLIEPLALAKGLRFDVSQPVDPVTLHTDSRKIRQVLINLLSNAVKFTTDGSVDLHVTIEGGTAQFLVCDTGPGIDAADQGRVFEPFWQARQNTPERAAGTGLGLAVSRRLAILLGGSLELVSSEPGEGTRFRLNVPVQAPEADGEPAA